MRVGVILPNWIGDVVMATPTFRALRKLVGPEGALVGVMRPYVADVLAGTEWFDQKILYEKSPGLLRVTRAAAFQELRAARLDRIILLTNSLRTAWLAWRSGARERIGFKNEARSLLLSKRVQQPLSADGKRAPTVGAYLVLADAAGCAAESPVLELATTPDEERAADAVWQQLGLPAGNRVVILNSGGAYGAAKQWPVEYFAELARRIVANEELSVLVNCGPAERDVARDIAALANNRRVVSLADYEDLPIGLTKACIRRSRLLVTTDSGPRYFGVAFGRPVVTLFGPTDPLRTLLSYEREISLSLSLECQPCMARVCPLGHHRCMRDLTVNTVHDAVLRLLERDTCESAA
jgi:heptosyltransferase II